ncbi:DDE-type integrase/transposase/recombinase [Halovulum sp. GXIMD14794]
MRSGRSPCRCQSCPAPSSHGLQWQVDEIDLRVGGRWRCLGRAEGQFGQPIDFRLTARRDAKAATAFLRKARNTVRSNRPLVIVTDKSHSHAEVIGEIKRRLGPKKAIRHADRMYLNDPIESDHAALKQRLRSMLGLQTLAGAKATPAGI